MECSFLLSACSDRMLSATTCPVEAVPRLGPDQPVAWTILRYSVCPSRYVLAKEEGSPRLGSMLERRDNSVTEVWRTERRLEGDIVAEAFTLDNTE